MSYRHRLLVKGQTLDKLEKKYGNYYVAIGKVNMFEHGCSMHKHITLCNKERNKCKHIYTVHSVSSLPMENHSTIADWRRVFNYA